MKNLNSLAALTDNASSDPEFVLSDTPQDVYFVVENNTLLPAPVPQKLSFDQIIQALMAGPLTDIANDPTNNLSLATFTGSGGLGDLNNDGEVSTADLLEFLTMFGNSWTDPVQSLFDESVFTFSDSDIVTLNDSTWTTLSFDLGDYSVTAGTQNVTVDHTTNHNVKFASQTSPYLLRDVPYKEILLNAVNGEFAEVTTDIANQTITVRAVIDVFNISGVALGAQGYFDWTEKTFGQAGTKTWNGPGQKQITSSEIATECGVTDGLDNTAFDSVVVTLQAKTDAGEATIRLKKPRITLRQNYIPE
jgi:hypothetical protein